MNLGGEMPVYKQVAERGCIYEFIEKDGSVKNDVLVVSSSARATDKIISVIMIGDNPGGNDIVSIKYDGKKRYLHCGCVTYAGRDRLGKRICKVADKTMAEVDTFLMASLGLVRTDERLYKHLYDDLLNKVIQNNVPA